MPVITESLSQRLTVDDTGETITVESWGQHTKHTVTSNLYPALHTPAVMGSGEECTAVHNALLVHRLALEGALELIQDAILARLAEKGAEVSPVTRDPSSAKRP